MNFDCILANPPYAKIGCDIVNKIVYDVPHKDISLLGTRAMLGKHNKRLALEYVYIEDYVLNPVCKVSWVQQLILLGHKGSCNVVSPTRYEGQVHLEERPNELRIEFTAEGKGVTHETLKPLLTRNRTTSLILSVSDEDYEYIKTHWNDMSYVERFWWLHDHGLYKRFVEKDGVEENI